MITIYKNNISDMRTFCDAFKRKKCYGKPIWVIFGGDGKPYMSRLKGFSCAKHLSRVVKQIMEAENALTTVLDDKDTFSEEEFEL